MHLGRFTITVFTTLQSIPFLVRFPIAISQLTLWRGLSSARHLLYRRVQSTGIGIFLACSRLFGLGLLDFVPGMKSSIVLPLKLFVIANRLENVDPK